MNKEQASEIVACLVRADKHFDQLIEHTKQLDEPEGRAIRRQLAEIIGEIYERVEMPIYAEFPDLPNRRDG